MIWEIHENTETIEGLDAAGRPDPAYAAALGLLKAPIGRRILAAVCDWAIWLLLQLPLWLGAVPLLLKLATGAISPYGFVNHPSFVLAVVMASITVVLTLVFGIVQWVLHGRKGVTAGKAIAGIRSVNVKTLEKPRAGAVLLRFLIVWASGLLPLIGPVLFLVSPTFDPDRRGRGWHDKATGVWLVDVRAGLNPFDEKRMRVARKLVKAEPVPERSALPSLATPMDPSAKPQYRPGNRVSAGVLGMAKPHEAHERPTVGLSQAVAAAQPTPGEAGKPVLGGYRSPDGEKPLPAARPAAGTGFPITPGAVPTAAAQPAAPAPAPQPAPVPQPAPQRAPAPQPAPQPAPVPQQHASTPQPAPIPQAAPAPQPAPVPASQPAPVPASQPAPTAHAAPASAPAMRFGLRLDTGESILVTEPVLLGRNPDATGHPGARAIALTDDSRSLSKTHLLVRPVDGGLEIVDCGSTNGSGLIRGGTQYGVAAGTPVMTTDGDMIRLGDRVAAVVRV